MGVFRASILVIGLFSVVVSGSAFGDFGTAPTPLNVFEPDNRQFIPQREAPFSQIFPITAMTFSAQRQMTCTASMVGPSLILTNAHCILMALEAIQDGTLVQRGRIFVSVRAMMTPTQGSPEIEARLVRLGSFRRLGDRAYGDWAILRLDRRIGDTLGYLPVSDEIEEASFPLRGVMLAGFGGDLFMPTGNMIATHRDCSIYGWARNSRRDPRLMHDCDTTRGNSGSPLLRCETPGRCRIIALNNAEDRDGGDASLVFPGGYDGSHPNIALSPIHFLSVLQDLLRQDIAAGEGARRE